MSYREEMAVRKAEAWRAGLSTRAANVIRNALTVRVPGEGWSFPNGVCTAKGVARLVATAGYEKWRQEYNCGGATLDELVNWTATHGEPLQPPPKVEPRPSPAADVRERAAALCEARGAPELAAAIRVLPLITSHEIAQRAQGSANT